MKTKQKKPDSQTQVRTSDGVVETKLSRKLDEAVVKVLWARSAGRCQLPGCNKIAYRASVTQDEFVEGEQAHIIGFSKKGPRGKAQISSKDLNNHENLMVLCREHHRNIDHKIHQEKYTVALLQKWKKEHEQRIEMVTGIAPTHRVHVVTYTSLIGTELRPLTLEDAAEALFPTSFPAEYQLNDLSLNLDDQDHEGPNYWESHARSLSRKFDSLKTRLLNHEVQEFAIFAIAPQPLLIKLGTLFPELNNYKVFQRHKHPSVTWKWPDHLKETPQAIKATRPEGVGSRPAIVLEFSAPVSQERIERVLPNASIYRIGFPKPNNDALKSPVQLEAFHREFRTLVDEIKAEYGEETPLHIFPVGPVSIAVECGKARTPKADAPWYLYDQNRKTDGFEHVLTIDEKGA